MKLNLGCGDNYLDGFVNLDKGFCKKDVEHDLENVPYPFKDNQFDYIVATNVLEHLNKANWFEIINELYRISSPNAIWEIYSPYALSDNFFTDPTHKMPLTTRSFDFFDPNKELRKLGVIYGIKTELIVLESNLVKNKPNGPDIYFKILVPKKPINITKGVKKRRNLKYFIKKIIGR